jgi:heat shock protein HspQ
MDSTPKFIRGRLVWHKKFSYRGVIVEVDTTFQGTEEWYEQVARSRPPKDKPWYRVLVHNAKHETYVAERHLEPDPSGEPVEHPALADHFDELRDGTYARTRLMN